ncbi:right-handed parallel beta-helix repeat-containing protein [Halosimplex aquaticum]
MLTKAIADNTLVYFPDGRYKLDYLEIKDTHQFGLVSIPNTETVLVPNGPISEIGNQFINLMWVSDVLLDGFEFDFSESDVGGALRVIAEGDIIARNLRTRGPLPDQNSEENHVAYRFEVQKPDAKGLVERVVARDGGHDGGDGVGIFVGKDHSGSLTFRNCEVANFPNNGLYASAPGQTLDGYTGNNGDIHVRGGRYENNNVANVRVGSTGSTVKDVTVTVDKVPPALPGGTLNVRGIWLRERNDLLVEDCKIEFTENAAEGFGAISYNPMHGSSTVRNTEIRVDRDDYNAIRAIDSSRGGTEAPLHFENVTVTGTAAKGAAIEIADRPKTTFQNCRIEQLGQNRSGILLIDSDNCVVADSTIRVSNQPIATRDASVDRENLTIETLSPAETTATPSVDPTITPPANQNETTR